MDRKGLVYVLASCKTIGPLMWRDFKILSVKNSALVSDQSFGIQAMGAEEHHADHS